MKWRLGLVFSVLGMVALASLATAANVRHGSGIIAIIRLDDKIVEVLEEGGRWIERRKFVVTNDTKVLWAGREIALDELKTGQEVEVSYIEANEHFEAKEIQVTAAPSESGKEFRLESSAFRQDEAIPSKYTCDGRDISPPLAWTDSPPGTKSFALISNDPDASGRTWTHWVVYNLSPALRELPEGLPINEQLPGGTLQGTNDFGRTGYGGPCPPNGTHRYFFKLFSLDVAISPAAGATAQELETAMKGHVLGEAWLMGIYRRQGP